MIFLYFPDQRPMEGECKCHYLPKRGTALEPSAEDNSKGNSMPSLQSASAIEPLQRQGSARFTIGQDRNGRWVVQDRKGLVGGVFISEHAARHFAADECDHKPEQICRAADGIVLQFGALERGEKEIH
jgi:hypothetical protein